MLELNKIHNMNCLEGLKLLEDSSISAIVTDPPYELSFMGKKWDNTGITYNTEVWKECLRVLKPGGYLLSFGGTRTYHRMACAIEDVGFEIRDQIMWVYGSGFPKSMDISKAIDKKAGAKREVIGVKPGHEEFINRKTKGDTVFKDGMEGFDRPWLHDEEKRQLYHMQTAPSTEEAKQWEGWGTALKPAHENLVLAQKPVSIQFVLEENIKEIYNCLTFFALIVEKNFMLNLQDINEVSNIVQWDVGKNINIQEDLKEVMDILQLEMKKENIDLSMILSWKNILEENYNLMNKYTIEIVLEMIMNLKILNLPQLINILLSTTKEKTNQKEQSANVLIATKNLIESLKKLNDILILFAQENVIVKEKEKDFVPNTEPIVVARKPLSEKTVAENVLKWGIGGINIDGCRIEGVVGFRSSGGFNSGGNSNCYGDSEGVKNTNYDKGRFPSNIILDEEAGQLLDEQSGIKQSTRHMSYKRSGGEFIDGIPSQPEKDWFVSEKGGASRFFYCAKASKKERGEGNNHPTVKPISLMQYLIRLVTPSNGIVLDPFVGSGTTCLACINENFQYIGFELDTTYCDIANKRIQDIVV